MNRRAADPRDGQRPLARVPAGPARHRRAGARAPDPGHRRLLELAQPRCTALAAQPRPRHRCAPSATRVYAQMAAAGYGAVGEFHYVHHQPDGTPVPGAQRDGDRARRGGGGGNGLEITLLPGRLSPRRSGTTSPTAGQRRFCDPSVEAFLERVDGLREWAAAPGPGRASGSRRTASARCPADWLEAIAQLRRRRTGSSATSTPPSSGASWPRSRPSTAARRSSCCTAPASSARARASIHAIHVERPHDVELLAASELDRRHLPDDRGQPRRRVLCRACAWYRDAGVRLAIGTDEQIRIDPFEELRELETLARREGHTRTALLAAAEGDLWGQMVLNGRSSLGLDRSPPDRIEINLDHPDLAGVAEQDLPLALATCASAAVVSAGVGPRR